MKQHITVKQLNELSEKGKKRLRKWWDKDEQYVKHYPLPLLSIGQMIEFLVKNDAFDDNWQGSVILPCRFDEINKLCDALFSAVKEVLEK